MSLISTIILAVAFVIMNLALIAGIVIGFSDDPEWNQPSEFATLQAEHGPWMLLAIPGAMVAAAIVVFNDGDALVILAGLMTFAVLWFGSFYIKLWIRARRKARETSQLAQTSVRLAKRPTAIR